MSEATELLEQIQSEVSGAVKEQKEAQEATTATLKTVYEMAKANGASVDEIRGAHNEYTEKLNSLTETVTKGFETQAELGKSIDGLNSFLTDAKKNGSLLGLNGEEASDTEVKSAAVKYFKSHYEYKHSTDTNALPFDAKSVTDDHVERFNHIRKGMANMFRATGAQVVLPDEQRSAISTVTHGDQFFLPIQVIRPEGLTCFTDETNLAARFDNLVMGAHTVVIPVNNVEEYGAVWQCEGKCDGTDLTVAQNGMVSMTVGDLVSRGCVTGTMARDSVIDVEQRLAMNADRSFDYAITRTYFSEGEGAMDGALAVNAHVTTHTAEAANLEYKDIIKMAVAFPTRFRNGVRWFGDCSMAAYLATMCDALGRPMVTPGANGAFNVFGIPFEQVDQMPSAFDENGALVPGAKGLALINLQEHYILGRRNDLRATRDAITGAGCDIIKWYFRQSLAGKVKCPNAARFLKVKEA